MTPKSLQQAILHFSDEQVCIDFIAKMRWPDGVRCPRCESERVSWIKSRKVWQCKDCRKQSSVKVGTIFEDSPILLSKWLPAIWLITSAKNGISSYELHRALDVTQKTAWFILHRIRFAMESDTSFKFSGQVEVDETFMGGEARFMHKREAMIKRDAVTLAKPPLWGFWNATMTKVIAQYVPKW